MSRSSANARAVTRFLLIELSTYIIVQDISKSNTNWPYSNSQSFENQLKINEHFSNHIKVLVS